MEDLLKDKSLDGGEYKASGSASHYKNDLIEFVDNIERLTGSVSAYLCCEANVTKYRGRANKKKDVSLEKDITKAIFYEKAAEYLKEKINLYNEVGQIDESWNSFDSKYGIGRRYITAPYQVESLFSREFNLIQFEFKGLGDIVEDKLSKK